MEYDGWLRLRLAYNRSTLDRESEKVIRSSKASPVRILPAHPSASESLVPTKPETTPSSQRTLSPAPAPFTHLDTSLELCSGAEEPLTEVSIAASSASRSFSRSCSTIFATAMNLSNNRRRVHNGRRTSAFTRWSNQRSSKQGTSPSEDDASDKQQEENVLCRLSTSEQLKRSQELVHVSHPTLRDGHGRAQSTEMTCQRSEVAQFRGGGRGGCDHGLTRVGGHGEGGLTGGKGRWARRVGYRGGSELEQFKDSRQKLLVRRKGRLLG